jgi:cell division septation protein DedD
MKNKETGEFELVVGNGQLLSGFFIVVLLFAVAFAMGFIVARAKYQQEPGAAASGSTPASAPATSRPSTAPMPVSAPADQPAPQPPPDSPAPAPAQAEPGTATQPEREANPDAVQKADEPATAPEAAAGTYWQVGVMARADAARTLFQTVKDMGLPATLSPGPNNMTRVLVGPYHDKASLAKVKTQLENAGLRPVQHTL